MKTRLKELMEKRGITRKQLADDLKIERRTLDNYVTEYTLMNSDMIKIMAEYFGVSTDYFLGVDDLSDEMLNERVDRMADELKSILYHLNHKEKDC